MQVHIGLGQRRLGGSHNSRKPNSRPDTHTPGRGGRKHRDLSTETEVFGCLVAGVGFNCAVAAVIGVPQAQSSSALAA
jgi:hypothetical protein